MSEKLTKEELLECLERWFASYRMYPGLTIDIDEEKQAYTQLKEIVKLHYNSVHLRMSDGSKIIVEVEDE